ncbi:hypothetical protein HF086_001164 [Spodoptera exigua]|uniref:Uncharacterized protein n=1 Tax=Spodoptera exigua TaxID=7107 RepID=A0A922M1G5_SPOEX|nr:hypothetical protein HF086_001164 [Spodoptera exigua]
MACETVPQDAVSNRRSGVALIIQKQRGDLTVPSVSVVNICFMVESLFRQTLKYNNNKPPVESNFSAVLSAKAISNLLTKTNELFPDLKNHLRQLCLRQFS